MPVFPSQNLNSQKICESYPKLLQIYDTGIVLDGTGSQQQFLNVTASYALNCNCPGGGGGATVTGSFCSSSVWTFNHNLGQKYVVIQTYDENDNQIIPEVVNLYDDNTAIIAFGVNACGTAVATTGGGTGGGGTSLHTGSTYPITSSWAINVLTASYVGDSVTGTFYTSSTWTFVHNLNDRPVVVQAYDINYNQLVPKEIILTNDNTSVLKFSVTQSGYVIATRSGYRTVSTGTVIHTGSTYPITSSWSVTASYALNAGTPLYTGSTYPITSSWALYTVTSSYIQVTGVSYPVKRIYNDYTIVRTTDYTLLCDASSGSFNVKLPNPVGNTNIYNIKKIDSTGHDIHVIVANASYIDFDFTQSIRHRGTNMSVQSDGTNQYWIL